MYCFSFEGPGHVRTDLIKALYNDRALILNATSNMLSSTKRQKLYGLPANNLSKCLQLSLSRQHPIHTETQSNAAGISMDKTTVGYRFAKLWKGLECITFATSSYQRQQLPIEISVMKNTHLLETFARDTSGFGT
jgi:hypothetical protein